MIKELCSSLGKCSSGRLLSAGLPVCRDCCLGVLLFGAGRSKDVSEGAAASTSCSTSISDDGRKRSYVANEDARW